MTPQQFLDLSTKLFNDMKAWVAEAGKSDSLAPADVASLEAAMRVIERVTLREADVEPGTMPDVAP
jgi:hypothetical protein